MHSLRPSGGSELTVRAKFKWLLRLQAYVRGWKARQDVHPSGPKDGSQGLSQMSWAQEMVRTLNDGEQIAISIKVSVVIFYSKSVLLFINLLILLFQI